MKRYFSSFDRWIEAREKWLVPMVAVLLLAGLVSYVYSRDPLDFGPFDGKLYEMLGWDAAQAESLLAEGNFRNSYWSPAWVATIGFIYKILGREPMVIRLLLALCAVGSGLLVNRWTRHRGLPASACLLAMVLTATGTLVYRFAAYCHYEIILGFGLVLFSWMVFNGNRKADEGGRSGYLLLAGSGLMFGFLSLMASKVIILLVVLPILQLLSGRKKHALRTGVVVSCSLLVIGGWTIRNVQVLGEFIPLTTNGGINLYIANNPDATGGYITPAFEGHEKHDSSYFRGLALDYIAENPGLTARRMLKKSVLFFNPHYGEQAAVFLLFFVALFRFFRKEKWWRDVEGMWFIMLPFVFMAVHSLFHYEFRYVLPVWPALAWVGAHAFAARSPRESLQTKPDGSS